MIVDEELEVEEHLEEEKEETSEELPEPEATDEQESEDEEHSEAGEDEDESEEDDGEIVVSIGDEEVPEEATEAPKWVKELRKSHRELQKRNKELEQKLSQSSVEKNPTQLAEKPKLEDFDYDTDAFETALESWHENKRKVDEFKSQKEAEQKQIEEQWQQSLASYEEKKASLKVRDYEDAEDVAKSVFDETQQGIIVHAADNPAVLVYALGKNHKKAKELSEIKDPVKFAFAVAKLETKLKVTNRKPKTKPESKVSRGTSRISGSGSSDAALDRLREEAAKTNDYSKVMAYKRKLKQKAASA